MANFLETISKNHLEILWCDGRGSVQRLCRAIASKHSGFKELDIHGSAFLRVDLSNNSQDLILASQILKLIGPKKTTIIRRSGLVVADKKALMNAIFCYEKSLNSRAKSYCLMKVDRNDSPAIGININMSAFGMDLNSLRPPVRAKRQKQLSCPCRIAFYTYPQPTSKEDWNEKLADLASEKHLNICPKYKGELV